MTPRTDTIAISDGRTVTISIDAAGAITHDIPPVLTATDAVTLGIGLCEAARLAGQGKSRAHRKASR